MRFVTRVLSVASVCLLAACASKHVSKPGSIASASVSESGNTTALRPTPTFAGDTTTVAGADQTYYFGFDGSQLDPKSMASLQAQADYLIQNPGARVRLEGNTDERGSREYNIGLGWRRDQAVKHILLQAGVVEKQVLEVSYGKERPAVFAHNEAAYAKNRRVNMIYEVK